MRRISFDPKLLFIVILFIAGFLRFYKLDWGDGFLFHPDEYHIVNSVNQLDFPTQTNPHFFSYGTFTIYLIYFTKSVFTFFGKEITYPQVFFIGRFYSALFSTLTIPAVYLISKKLFKDLTTSNITTALVAFLPGLIQQAHFATPESSLIFWIFLTMLLCMHWWQTRKNIFLYLSGATFGIALAVKVVALALAPVYAVLFFSGFKFTLRHFIGRVKIFLTTLILVLITFLVVFPYSLLDWKSFKYSVTYEGGIARGQQEVFYTRQFFETKPVLFQYQNILPYTLGPVIPILGTLGFFYILFWLAVKEINDRKKSLYKILKPERNDIQKLWQKFTGQYANYYLFLILPFILLFLPDTFLFTKWTRFIAPTFIIFVLLTGVFFESLRGKKNLQSAIILLTFLSTFTWSLMFFSIYTKPDVRVAATRWIQTNIDSSSFILTEAKNMLEVPLNGSYQKLPFDFYELDQNPWMLPLLAKNLEQADYFIIQSRRIYINHMRLSQKYPLAANFYRKIFAGDLGFREVQEFTSYPYLSFGTWSLVIPDENAEETWSVFDHPRLMVFKKELPLTEDEILSILNQ